MARELDPGVVAWMVAGHVSTEPAARLALHALGLEPLVDLQLRLGEGSGGLLALPHINAAALTLAEMAIPRTQWPAGHRHEVRVAEPVV